MRHPKSRRAQPSIARHCRQQHSERSVHGGVGGNGDRAAKNRIHHTADFLATALLNAVVAIYIFTLVPEFLMRFMVWLLIHSVYRLEKADSKIFRQTGRRYWCATTLASSTH
jgi:hypothetical protein